MNEDIKFSILIPTFKAKFLKDCLDSILMQTYSNYEIIIVNDASPECIDEIVNQFNDSRIQYYVNEKNIGAVDVVKNWNKCLSFATGSYCICMGDDDKLLPCCLAEYRKLIEKYPNVELLHGWTELIDENGDFVRYQYERPEWESVYALIYNRWTHRFSQFIGDFCFKTEPLKNRSGFYYLPLAWCSDDISAVHAAIAGGVVNTQVPCFQYRNNSLTISNSDNVEEKIEAFHLSFDWYRIFLKEIPTEQIAEKYHRLLVKITDEVETKLVEECLASSMANFGIYRVFSILKKYRFLRISIKMVLRSFVKGLLRRFLKGHSC